MEIHFIILGIFLCIAFYYDAIKQIIPNWLNVSGAVVGVGYHSLSAGVDGFIQSFGGGLVCGIILLVLYVFKAIGAGDVKLFFAIGTITGILFGLYSIMYSIICAGIIGLLYLLFTRTFLIQLTLSIIHMRESIQEKSLTPMEEFKRNRATRFPFIFAVIPGVLITFYYMVVLGG